MSQQELSSGDELEELKSSIDRYNASQPNAAFLDELRAYNHLIIDTLDGISPLSGHKLLDVGASPHGYAMERALARGARRYVGIGLDIEDPFIVESRGGTGELIQMNAESMVFPANTFDFVVSMSTFEHIADPGKALSEIRRVLVPGGKALITFEPVWSCSYGHHLHHFGDVARLVPDWAHLLWTKDEFLSNLRTVWPDGSPLPLEEAARWVYDSDALNRIGIADMMRLFDSSGMRCLWQVPLQGPETQPSTLASVAERTRLPIADLSAKGLSALLEKLEGFNP